MRNTKQNELILSIINCSSSHFTAEDIYMQCRATLPNISLGTVYRNLNKLVDSKKIRRIKMPNNIDRYDKNIIHSHVICSKCGCIEDVFTSINIELPVLKNYVISDYELSFNGICNDCKKKES